MILGATSSPSERKEAYVTVPLMGRLSVAFVPAVLAVILTTAALAGTSSEVGHLIVKQPCCADAALQGSRSYIRLPTSPSVGGLRQVLSSVSAQDDVLGIAQLGITMNNDSVEQRDL